MKTRNISVIPAAIFFVLVFLPGISPAFARQGTDTSFTETDIKLPIATGEIAGTLTMPEQTTNIPVALIIAGSGPTDRNGNSGFIRNDALKLLAHGLAENGIASVRYDKRGIAASMKSGMNESDLRFETYISDAEEWIKLLKQDKRFSKVIVIGHSEGSLIGMVAGARSGADQFISIAGVGRPVDEVLKEQLKAASEDLYNLAVPVLDSLKQGHPVKNVDGRLYTIFRPSVQPYMISWLKYDPRAEIKKLTIPVLIIQGTNDIQVPVSDAEKLLEAKPDAQLLLIDHMNHILKEVQGDRQENIASYQDPALPLSEGLVKSIAEFVKQDRS